MVIKPTNGCGNKLDAAAKWMQAMANTMDANTFGTAMFFKMDFAIIIIGFANILDARIAYFNSGFANKMDANKWMPTNPDANNLQDARMPGNMDAGKQNGCQQPLDARLIEDANTMDARMPSSKWMRRQMDEPTRFLDFAEVKWMQGCQQHGCQQMDVR